MNIRVKSCKVRWWILSNVFSLLEQRKIFKNIFPFLPISFLGELVPFVNSPLFASGLQKPHTTSGEKVSYFTRFLFSFYYNFSIFIAASIMYLCSIFLYFSFAIIIICTACSVASFYDSCGSVPSWKPNYLTWQTSTKLAKPK